MSKRTLEECDIHESGFGPTFSSCATRGRRFDDVGIDAALTEGNQVDVRYFSAWGRSPHGSSLGSKGIGELGICGAGAAIMNAIHNATGARIRDFPATPDKLLATLETLDG
jgi:CO/xanthine dehydrogenase Mo-binding subunit